MSRITSNNNIRTNGCQTSTQLQLDAAFSSFSTQATDSFTIASMTAAGLIGKVARVGILSVGARLAVPLLNIFSHLGSIAAEASTITILQHGSFSTHLLNFAMFRFTGGLGVANPLGQFASQSATMVAAHQVAAAIGFEEASPDSLAQQFFKAGLSTFQIQTGSHFAHLLGSGRIKILERSLESEEITNQSSQEGRNCPSRLHLLSSSDTPTPPEGITERFTRIAKINPVELPNTSEAVTSLVREITKQISDFQYSTELLSNFLSQQYLSIVSHTQQVRNGYFLLSAHARLCGGSKGLWSTIEREGRAEGLPNLDSMLAEKISFFASHVIAFERSGLVDLSECKKMREQIYTSYDQLQLIRESLRLVMRLSPADETPYYQAIGNAYKGLLKSSQRQSERVRSFTKSTVVQIDEKAVDQWAEYFFANCTQPRAALNAQIIRGRIKLFRGEVIRGNFYEALRDCPTEAIKTARVLYDPISGQIVDFYDRHSQAELSRQAFQMRGIILQEAIVYVDPVESGQITHVQIDANPSSQARNALEKLVGFQVLPSNRIRAYANWEDTAQNNWSVSFVWNVCEDPSQLYRLRAISKPVKMGPAEDPTEWHLFTLDSLMNENEGFQLWVPRNSFKPEQPTKIVKVLRLT